MTLRPVPLLGFALALFASLSGCAAPVQIAPAAPAAPSVPAGPMSGAKVSGAARLDHEHDKGVVLQLQQAAGRASVEFNYPAGALDLSGFRDLAVTVNNQSSVELDVFVTGLSALVDTYLHTAQTRFLVRPGEQTDLCVFMARGSLPKDHPFIKRLGDLYAFPWGFQRHWQHLDPAGIVRVTAQVQWLGASPGQAITVSRPFGHGFYSVDPAQLDSLVMPVVDEFGQDRAQSWPGKVESIADMRNDAAKDAALVVGVTRPKGERNIYGGDTRSPARKATGFFRVEKVDGKWWFIDPEGHLFWSLGVNCAATSSPTRVKGREALFPASARNVANLDHYVENVKLKHNVAAWRKEHADVTLARMMDWGLNTVGAWSMDELTEARRVPYSLITHVGYQRIGSNTKVADPYSEDFKADLEKNLAELAALHADSPWLLGVFIDNELDWKNGAALAEDILGSAPHTPARLAFIAFLRERYPDLAALNLAWGSTFGSFDTARPRAGAVATSAYQQDLRDYLGVYANTYFAACAAAMDKHFPNHLYLGCRFHIVNPIITAAAARYCDVLSVNAYRYSVADLSLNTTADKPYIISEYHFGTRDHGVWGGGLTWAADARNQSDLVHAYLSDALRHPNIIGAHWFQWSGQAITGRFDGENFGVGLVTIVDRPVESLVKAFNDVSGALYDYRISSNPARIGAPLPADPAASK